ncbi:MAG TPA: hypothetical protein VF642_05925 [Propionibacteriaceae bacterium]
MSQPVAPLSATEQAANESLPPPSAAPHRRLFLPTLYVLRVLATLNALLVLAQAWSIGQYLNGDYPLLGVHGTGAGIAILSALILGLVAVVHVLSGGPWRVLAAVPLFFAEGFQTGMGYARQLGIHVPLGVAIVTLAVLLALWCWSPSAARPRRRSPR